MSYPYEVNVRRVYTYSVVIRVLPESRDTRDLLVSEDLYLIDRVNIVLYDPRFPTCLLVVSIDMEATYTRKYCIL